MIYVLMIKLIRQRYLWTVYSKFNGMLTFIFRNMTIQASQINGYEGFEINIENEKIQALMQLFEGDFNYLANHLKLMEDKMVLFNPKFKNLEEPQI